MPVLNSCRSSQTKVSTETVDVFFPAFPEAPSGAILPLDINGKRVTEPGTEVVNVVLPYWYWKEIVRYVTETEEAVQALSVKSVYFPAFPEAPSGAILPLDINGKRVTQKGEEIVNVVMPYWYWKEICRYVTETEEAVQTLSVK